MARVPNTGLSGTWSPSPRPSPAYAKPSTGPRKQPPPAAPPNNYSNAATCTPVPPQRSRSHAAAPFRSGQHPSCGHGTDLRPTSALPIWPSAAARLPDWVEAGSAVQPSLTIGGAHETRLPACSAVVPASSSPKSARAFGPANSEARSGERRAKVGVAPTRWRIEDVDADIGSRRVRATPNLAVPRQIGPEDSDDHRFFPARVSLARAAVSCARPRATMRGIPPPPRSNSSGSIPGSPPWWARVRMVVSSCGSRSRWRRRRPAAGFGGCAGRGSRRRAGRSPGRG
jgi:hypothetical protein